jgi:hypothetical protein
MNAEVDTAGVIVPIADGEPMLRSEKREISILVAREEVTITHARYAAGERIRDGLPPVAEVSLSAKEGVNSRALRRR